MTISRGQMNRQLYMGGGIMNAMPREQFGIGSSLKKLGKKAVGAVKDIASSDIGKAALAGAAVYGLGGGFGPDGFSFGKIPGAGFFAGSGAAPGSFRAAQQVGLPGTRFGQFLTGAKNAITGSGNIGKFAALGAVSTFLTSTLGMSEEQAEEEVARDPSKYLSLYYKNLNPNASEEEVQEFVTTNTSEYAEGGRIGFDMGGTYDDFEEFMMRRKEAMSERQKEELKRQFEMFMRSKDPTVEAAEGGRIGYAEGSDDKIPAELLAMSGFRDAGPVLPEFNLESNIIPLSNDGEFKYTTPSEILPEFKYMSDGPVLPPDPTQPVNPFAPKPTGPVLPNKEMASNMENDKILEALFEKFLDMGLSPERAAEEAKKEFERMSMMQTEGRGLAAMGGRMNYALGDTASQNAMQAAGIEGLPIRQNPKGVKELDLRDNGGFIPPVGIKEKEDDIPAMLSNNEFVFTADAVRGMGDGDVELGAQRMYDQMKMLEAGGRV